MRPAATLTLLLVALLLTASCNEEGTVTAKELKKLIDEGSVLVVDTRWAEEYGEGHLPKAVNIQPYQIRNIVQFLPAEKERPLVFYCRGYG